MFFIINKVCDPIPFKKEDIKIVEKLNDLVYEIKLNNEKTRRINFANPDKYENENKMLIILDKQMYSILDSIKASDKLKFFICDMIVDCNNLKTKRKHIKQELRRRYFKYLWIKTKIYFLGLWHCGILGRKMNITIRKDDVELRHLLPYIDRVENTKRLVKAYVDPKLESKKSYKTRKKWFDFLESF